VIKRLPILSLVLAVVAAALAGAPALAAGGEAVEMRDGPGAKARDLEPFWIMRCAHGTRLVGLRVHADRSIAGVEAICAGLVRDGDTIAWLSKPRLWLAPPIPPPPPRPAPPPPRSEGTVLRAESGTVMRYRGSRALVISVPRAKEPPPGPKGPYLLPFRATRKTTDLVCPNGRYVAGLRAGSVRRDLTAVQILCGDGSAAAPLAVGDWPAPAKPAAAGKKKRNKRAPVFTEQRVQCAGVSANPLDGTAADAVFGTIADGRIQSLGLTCAS
jgi:hypothetical protein